MFLYILREQQKVLTYWSILRKFYSTDVNTSFLRTLFDCDYYTAYKTLKEIEELQTYDTKLIEENVNLLNQYGIQKSDIMSNAKVLLLEPYVTKNRLYFLEEGGFKKFDCSAVFWFMSIIQKKQNILKAHGYISQDADIIGSFLSYVETSPVVSPPSYNISDFDTLEKMNDIVLKYYLSWRLNIDPKKLTKKLLKYFRGKSFRMMSKIIKVLEEEVEFSSNDILKHPYLANCDPYNIANIMGSIKYLGGQNIKVVLKNNPKILLANFESIVKIAHHLQDFKIPDSSVSNNFEIFTLDSEIVIKRLNEMQDFPEFRAYRTHPRVLDLILNQEKVLTRLDHLHDMNLQCMTLNILHTSMLHFQRFLNKGSDKATIKDIVQYLAVTLGEDKTIIYDQISRHPLRLYVPLITVQKTMDLLLDEGFTRGSIVPNVQLTLYSWMLVKDHLKKLLTRPELRSEHLLTSDKPYFNQKQLLSFCLYFIERDYHFSGNGVWYEHRN